MIRVLGSAISHLDCCRGRAPELHEQWLAGTIGADDLAGIVQVAGVKRRIVIDPPGSVLSGQEDETEWPNKAKAMHHVATVDPAGGPTVFTAKLTMPPLPTSDFPEQSATVTVNDKRLDAVKKSMFSGLSYVNDTDKEYLPLKKAKAHYTGGQCPIEITPYTPPLNLFSSYANARHRVFMSATVSDDSFLIKGLNVSAEAIGNPLVHKDESWSAEKMVLIPSLMTPPSIARPCSSASTHKRAASSPGSGSSPATRSRPIHARASLRRQPHQRFSCSEGGEGSSVPGEDSQVRFGAHPS